MSDVSPELSAEKKNDAAAARGKIDLQAARQKVRV